MDYKTWMGGSCSTLPRAEILLACMGALAQGCKRIVMVEIDGEQGYYLLMEVIRGLHDVPSASHFGEKRSVASLLKVPVFWFGFKEDMRLYCPTCDDCLRCMPVLGRENWLAFRWGHLWSTWPTDCYGWIERGLLLGVHKVMAWWRG